jgi:hypothetical protein
MLELIELIAQSPLGAAAGTAFQNSLCAVIAIADCDDCGFNDLGKLLFGGIIAAVLVGVALSLLRHKLNRDQNHGAFVTIRSSERESRRSRNSK